MTGQNYRDCLKEPRLAQFLHICFRYDKSKKNERADILDLPLDYPIGVYHPAGAAPRTFTMITGNTVSSVMQQACQLAYPDPNHYCRLNINLLMSHSNRVTAAIALYNAGINIPVIMYRLRWSVESVTFYLRDCFMAIGPLTEAAINGAYLN
jgi:hypothetical protein